MKAIFLDGPLEDTYGFARRFREMTNDQLDEAFNKQVGNTGYVSARGNYLIHLRDEFLSRSLNCTSFIQGNEMILDYLIEIVGNTVQIIIPSRKSDS